MGRKGKGWIFQIIFLSYTHLSILPPLCLYFCSLGKKSLFSLSLTCINEKSGHKKYLNHRNWISKSVINRVIIFCRPFNECFSLVWVIEYEMVHPLLYLLLPSLLSFPPTIYSYDKNPTFLFSFISLSLSHLFNSFSLLFSSSGNNSGTIVIVDPVVVLCIVCCVSVAVCHLFKHN